MTAITSQRIKFTVAGLAVAFGFLFGFNLYLRARIEALRQARAITAQPLPAHAPPTAPAVFSPDKTAHDRGPHTASEAGPTEPASPRARLISLVIGSRRALTEARYAWLLEELDLGLEAREALVELLSLRELGAFGPGGSTGPWATEADLHQYQTAVDAVAETILSPPQFTRYAALQREIPVRNLVLHLRNMTASIGAPLSLAQEADLVSVIRSVPSSAPSTQVERRDLALGLGEAVVDERVLASVRGLLSEDQLGELRAIQRTQQVRRSVDLVRDQAYRAISLP